MSPTFEEVVREYFPKATDEDVDHILCTYTGFPCFFQGDLEESLRGQLQELKDSIQKGDRWKGH